MEWERSTDPDESFCQAWEAWLAALNEPLYQTWEAHLAAHGVNRLVASALAGLGMLTSDSEPAGPAEVPFVEDWDPEFDPHASFLLKEGP